MTIPELNRNLQSKPANQKMENMAALGNWKALASESEYQTYEHPRLTGTNVEYGFEEKDYPSLRITLNPQPDWH